jgi:hypothetical protein
MWPRAQALGCGFRKSKAPERGDRQPSGEAIFRPCGAKHKTHSALYTNHENDVAGDVMVKRS